MPSTLIQPMADWNRALASPGEADDFDSLLRAAEAGCLRAQTLAGWVYQTGRGVAVDFKRAEGWYRKAAAGGDSVAIANLGIMSLLGQGAPADYVEAFIWLQTAVGLGHKPLRPVLDQLERRITGAGGAAHLQPAVCPQIPAMRPCAKAACDPSRCSE